MSKFELLNHDVLSIPFKKGILDLQTIDSHESNNSIENKDEIINIKKHDETLYQLHSSNHVDNINQTNSEVKIVENSTQKDDLYKNCLNNIFDSLTNFYNENNSKINEFLHSITVFSVIISKNIIDKEFKNAEYYEKLSADIMSALNKIEKKYVITIKINSKHKEALLNDFSSNTYLTNNIQYKLVFDDNLTEYDSIVEWEDGKIENILQNKIKQLESLITEYLVGLNKKYG